MVRKDKLSHEGVERLVEKALATLLEEFQSYLESVVVIIEDEPPDDMPDAMGLYEGVPLVERLVWWVIFYLPGQLTALVLIQVSMPRSSSSSATSFRSSSSSVCLVGIPVVTSSP